MCRHVTYMEWKISTGDAMIQVRFFASLREQMGCDGKEVAPTRAATIADVWRIAAGGEPMPANILCAINMEYSDPSAEVADGDEVAFFPPVTGG